MLLSTVVVGAVARQTLTLGGGLWFRSPDVVLRTLKGGWSVALFAGFMGATASAAWFSGLFPPSTPSPNRATPALSEMVFATAVSRRFFREHLSPRELLRHGAHRARRDRRHLG
jgi:drug/metabolite transporter (DMT)-like permease